MIFWEFALTTALNVRKCTARTSRVNCVQTRVSNSEEELYLTVRTFVRLLHFWTRCNLEDSNKQILVLTAMKLEYTWLFFPFLNITKFTSPKGTQSNRFEWVYSSASKREITRQLSWHCCKSFSRPQMTAFARKGWQCTVKANALVCQLKLR